MSSEAPEVVLIFAANPDARMRLGLDREVREIENALRCSSVPFEVKPYWAVRPQDLRRALLEHKPTYVHFCGHGAGADGIALERDSVDAAALARLFGLFSGTIKCVVLNSCYSTVPATAVSAHVPFVVGMDAEIGDKAAVEFAAAFYDALGAGKSITFAFKLGCNAIELAGLSEHLTPQLLTRDQRMGGAPADQPAAPRASRADWDGAPAVSTLFGRNDEADTLRSWILDESCRVVLITGLGGVGKTDLVTCLGRGGNRGAGATGALATGIHGHFECVVWRSLLNAPPPEALFTDILGFLSDQRIALGDPLGKQLERLLVYLQQRRCLIILDNVEAVLKPGDSAMGYREGYEPYGTFFELVAKTEHHSCLLLTSRETPRAIAALEGKERPVRSLNLTGIGVRESRRLFGEISRFSGNKAHWSEIARVYHGNPLALELAARHIQQVFNGDLAAFLASGRPVFSDLKELLDWHVGRLTREEMDLVYWFAIEREPVSLGDLGDDLISAAARRELPSTLQSLQRRLSLERVGRTRFTLQPVLLEHVTARLVDQVALAFTRAHSTILKGHQPAGRRGATRELPGSDEQAGDHEAQGLTRDEYRALSTALLAAFPSKGELAQLVRFGLGENIEALAGGDNLREVVFRLLQQTESRGWTDRLLTAAVRARPQHRALKAIVERQPAVLLQGGPGDARAASGLELLNTHALIKATSKEAVRDSQRRLILEPIAERIAGYEQREIRSICAGFIEAWRRDPSHQQGYLAGNLINLLSHLKIDLAQVSFAHVPIFQACLHDVNANAVDFSFASFRQSTFKQPLGTVFCLAYSPAGESVAVGDDNGEVRVFHAESGQLRFRCRGHADGVRAVAFSRDGGTIASGSFDNSIRLWSAIDGQFRGVLLGHQGWVYSLAFSPDGRRLASASEDGTCRVWDLATGCSVTATTTDPDFLAAVAFSPDGELLAAGGSGGYVSLFHVDDLDHPKTLATHAGRIRAIAFSAQGDMLASGAEDGRVHIYRPTDGQLVATLAGHSGRVASLSFSAIGDVLASGSQDHTVRLWSTVRQACIGQIQVADARVTAVDCNPRGRTVVTGSEDAAVRVWDMDSGQCLLSMRGYSNMTWSLAASPDPSLIVAGNEDGKVRVWDTDGASTKHELTGHTSRIWAVACSPDGRWIASASDDLTVRIWDPGTGACRHVLRGHADWIRSVTFDPSSRLVASAGEDGRICIWDIARGGAAKTIEVATPRLFTLRFFRGGSGLAVGGSGHEIHLFDSSDGQPVGKLAGHEGWLAALFVSEATLGSCSEDGTVKIWDLSRMECTVTFKLGAKAWCGAFVDHARQVLCGGDDGILRLWSQGERRCEVSVRAHEGPVWCCALSADERFVATAGDDGAIRLWDLPLLEPRTSPNLLRPTRPYEGMNVSGATGLTPAQREALEALGAIAMPVRP